MEENEKLHNAIRSIERGDIASATTNLSKQMSDSYCALRRTIDSLAENLHKQIGLQLDVENYCADNPERGATLNTIDLPITDCKWLKNKLDNSAIMSESDRTAYLKRIIHRNTVAKDEYYFSFALNGFTDLGVRQKPDFYMNFQGDRPNVNNGELPVCMFKLYDHFSFSCKCAGFSPATDYILQITFKDNPNTITRHYKVEANEHTIYEGKQFGGYRNTEYEKEMLPKGYAAVCYDLPSEIFINGCLELNITEPMTGFQFSEFRIIKKNK